VHGIAAATLAGEAMTDPKPDDDIDPREVNPTFPKVAGAMSMFSGAMALLAGVQMLDTLRFRGAWVALPWLLAALGACMIVAGGSVFTSRHWGAIAGVVIGGLLSIVGGSWLLLSVLSGYLGGYSLLTAPTAGVSTFLCVLALEPCNRATRARARLAAQGMGLGV